MKVLTEDDTMVMVKHIDEYRNESSPRNCEGNGGQNNKEQNKFV
jgi:hypothetical protein